MTDGKVTGWTGSGRGVNTLATGDWAKLAGKGYTWTGRSADQRHNLRLKPRTNSAADSRRGCESVSFTRNRDRCGVTRTRIIADSGGVLTRDVPNRPIPIS